MVFFWVTAFILFLIAEAATVSLVTIWFALGSVAALVAAAVGAPLWLQFALFIVASIAVLVLLRPAAQKFMSIRKMPTNADRVIGMACPVTEPIDNIAGTGTVTVDGKVWAARSVDGANIRVGAVVRPISIQGVKLIVERVSEPRENRFQRPEPQWEKQAPAPDEEPKPVDEKLDRDDTDFLLREVDDILNRK